MKPLVKETLTISQEIKGAIFIGAIARYFHTKDLRESEDIDFAVDNPITGKELEDLGYTISDEGGKTVCRTPRRIKVDIYRKDVSGIPIQKIIDSVKIYTHGKQRIKVMGVEAFIIAKHRANRDQDQEDLYAISQTKFNEIKWDVMKEITDSDVEFKTIETAMKYLKSI